MKEGFILKNSQGSGLKPTRRGYGLCLVFLEAPGGTQAGREPQA